jgi:hypothetical protein
MDSTAILSESTSGVDMFKRQRTGCMVEPSNLTNWLRPPGDGDVYGLRNGQTRSDTERRVHNGVWFNCRWRMLGWGDLSTDDFVTIARAIPFGELFIVADSHFQPIVFDVDSCLWLIERRMIYLVLRYSDNLGDETYNETIRNVRFRRIIRPTARRIIARFQRLNTR